MAIAGVSTLDAYRDHLRDSTEEKDLLAKDLLINVTRFFRDEWVFDALLREALPSLVSTIGPEKPLRVWVAGCSTGEEAYSIAILIDEFILASGLEMSVQVFASDIDEASIAFAREAMYPASIEASVSAERLARYFLKHEGLYRIRPDIRTNVIFTVHNLLTDTPFSHIDLVSCRNVFIYLTLDAQEKAVSAFHFSLRKGGLLVLGKEETLGASSEDRFASASAQAKIYRHLRRSAPGEANPFWTVSRARSEASPDTRLRQSRTQRRDTEAKNFLLQHYAPASILIDRDYQCVYTTGSMEPYLRVVSGEPTTNLFMLVRDYLSAKVRVAVERASQEKDHVSVQLDQSDGKPPLRIDVEPVEIEDESFLLVIFMPLHEARDAAPEEAGQQPRVNELEQALAIARQEFDEVVHNFEDSAKRQNLASQEALLINEEYQTANEELLSSKEELESLNEELTALNYQLNQTLERERSTFSDLQNVLNATDVATLFLDGELNIRFSTPAIASIFKIRSGDIGRSIADLRSSVDDSRLMSDATSVIGSEKTIEREIAGDDGSWHLRRVFPYRTPGIKEGGVVVTYSDITASKKISSALELTERRARNANLAKSRFLAAASHDLRQPLQAISLIQDLLGQASLGEEMQPMVHRLGRAVSAMKSVLDTLLEINLIESGTLPVKRQSVLASDIIDQMREEFDLQASTVGIRFRTVACNVAIDTDPTLLANIIRNLLSNALKHTHGGHVLLGCRRAGASLRLEVWDSGVGIKANDLPQIFDEYYQSAENEAVPGSGSGLGLAIVRRLANLLHHDIEVSSNPGSGSVFMVTVPLARGSQVPWQEPEPLQVSHPQPQRTRARRNSILVVDDDDELRELLRSLLAPEYDICTASDGRHALDLMARRVTTPDLLLVDYALPHGMTGVDFIKSARERHQRTHLPAVILTGAISEDVLKRISDADCERLSKPVSLQDLRDMLSSFLGEPAAPGDPPSVDEAETTDVGRQRVFFIDDNELLRDEFHDLLTRGGMVVETFHAAEDFLERYPAVPAGCVLIDVNLPGMSGIEVTRRIKDSPAGNTAVVVAITGEGDVQLAVKALQAGAVDFLEKPITGEALLESVRRALVLADTAGVPGMSSPAPLEEPLTPRQQEVLEMILVGKPNKIIAADLGISQRTVENHRAEIMRRMGADSLADLVKKSFGVM